jgi:hypothetical protein
MVLIRTRLKTGESRNIVEDEGPASEHGLEAHCY